MDEHVNEQWSDHVREAMKLLRRSRPARNRQACRSRFAITRRSAQARGYAFHSRRLHAPNSFDDIDTYTSHQKQFQLLDLVLSYYHESLTAMEHGARLQDLANLPVREQISRFKTIPEEQADKAYQEIHDAIREQASAAAQ